MIKGGVRAVQYQIQKGMERLQDEVESVQK